jgi:2-C-methyl-D-erythritol 4-phosphate cytidylyltransferase
VLLLAAGSGSRVGAATNKVLLPLQGRPVLAWSVRTVTSLPYVDRVVVVARREDVDAVREVVETHLPGDARAELVVGGATRHDSEWRGLAPLRDSITGGTVDVVVVHDVARPLADRALFDATVAEAHEHGGAVPVRPQPGLLTAAGDRHVRGLVGVQTPQAFRAAELLDAYVRAEADGFTGTDTASCFTTYARLPVVAVPAPATNLKITFPEDVALAERLLGSGSP